MKTSKMKQAAEEYHCTPSYQSSKLFTSSILTINTFVIYHIRLYKKKYNLIPYIDWLALSLVDSKLS